MDKNNKWYGVAPLRAAWPLAAALAVLAPLAAPASAAAGPERSLAGIAIFAPGTQVTRKFGNPSQILVGGAAPASATFSTPGGQGGGFPGGPGGGGFPGGQGGPGGFSGAQGGFPGGGGFPGAGGGLGRSDNAGAGLLPGFPGIPSGGGFPGASGGFPGASGGFPGASGGFPGGGQGGFPGGAVSTAPIKQPVTLVYNRPNGGSLEFTISPDKRVVQIRETGYIGAYGTARGVKLGMSYSAVIAKYGYQEDTMIAGSIINIDYKDTLHCGFQFLDQRLVAIIVTSPD